MQCIFEEETTYPDGTFTHSKCINKADILLVNDPCYGLCFCCAYQKVKIENEQLIGTIEAALRIKKLWFPEGVWEASTHDEQTALCIMHTKFVEALK